MPHPNHFSDDFSEHFSDRPGRRPEERRALADSALWSTLGTLYRWRRFILGVTVGAAVLAVVISLLLPNWYKADTRLLLPARSGTGLLSAAFMEDLPTAAKSLLGGASGDYARYLSILSSRPVFEAAVDRFRLVEVYETGDNKTPKEDAIKMLGENVEFVVDEEYEFLALEVLDTDPQRAADIANFLVAELNRINSQLSMQSASQFRHYVEERYNENQAKMDSVLNAVRAFQEQYGVLNLEVQGEQFFEYMAALRVAGLQAESEYQVLLSQFGPDNTAVQTARQAAQAANRNYEQALAGQERLLPVSKEKLPMVARRYVNLEQEALILAKLIEYTRPILEEARFDEQRKVEAVQVIYLATPPVKKAKPQRGLLCITATLSAFLLAILFALVYTWWQRQHRYIAYRLRQAAAEAASAEAASAEAAAEGERPSSPLERRPAPQMPVT